MEEKAEELPRDPLDFSELKCNHLFMYSNVSLF